MIYSYNGKPLGDEKRRWQMCEATGMNHKESPEIKKINTNEFTLCDLCGALEQGKGTYGNSHHIRWTSDCRKLITKRKQQVGS